MIVTAYLDESCTHNESEIFVVAGYVGHAAQWRKFDKKWKRLLAKYELPYFHAKEIKPISSLCRGWSQDKCNELFRETERLSHQASIFSFISSLKKSEYNEIYKVHEKRRPKGMIAPDSMYGACFRYCISLLPVMLEKVFGDKEITLHVILEGGHNNVYDAVRIWGLLKTHREPLFQRILGTVTIAKKSECYGIQAADGLAYTGHKYEKRDAPVVTHPMDDTTWQKSLALAETQGKSVVPCYQLRFGRDTLKELKIKLLSSVKPRGRGRLLWEQEQNAKAALMPTPPTAPEVAGNA